MKNISRVIALILCVCMVLTFTSCDSPEEFLAVMGQILPFDVSMDNVFGDETEEDVQEMDTEENSAPTFDVLPLSSDEQEMLKSILFKAEHMLVNKVSAMSTEDIGDTELLYFANQYFTEEGAPQPDSTNGGWTVDTVNGVISSIFNTEIKDLSEPDSSTGWTKSGEYLSAEKIDDDISINVHIIGSTQINQTDHHVRSLVVVEKKNRFQEVLDVQTEITRDETRSFGFYIKSIESVTSEGMSGAEIMATSQVSGYDSQKAGDGDNNSMWCENVDGNGKNEALTFSWFAPKTVNAITVCNAAKSGGCRVKKLELTFSDGSTEDITLEDGETSTSKVQFFRLSREVKTEFIKFTIKSVYGGSDSTGDKTYIAEIGVY